MRDSLQPVRILTRHLHGTTAVRNSVPTQRLTHKRRRIIFARENERKTIRELLSPLLLDVIMKDNVIMPDMGNSTSLLNVVSAYLSERSDMLIMRDMAACDINKLEQARQHMLESLSQNQYEVALADPFAELRRSRNVKDAIMKILLTHVELIRNGKFPFFTKPMNQIFAACINTQRHDIVLNTLHAIAPKLITSDQQLPQSQHNIASSPGIVLSLETLQIIAKIILDQNFVEKGSALEKWIAWVPEPKSRFLTDVFWAELLKERKGIALEADEIEHVMSKYDCKPGPLFYQQRTINASDFLTARHYLQATVQAGYRPTVDSLARLIELSYVFLTRKQADQVMVHTLSALKIDNPSTILFAAMMRGLATINRFNMVYEIHSELKNANMDDVHTWNALLFAALRDRRLTLVANIVTDMIQKGLLIYKAQMDIMIRTYLPPRKKFTDKQHSLPRSWLAHGWNWIPRKNREVTRKPEEFLIRVFAEMLAKGSPVRPSAWKLLLTRLAMVSRTRELEYVSKWVLTNYNPSNRAALYTLSQEFVALEPSDRMHPFNRIFSGTLVRETIRHAIAHHPQIPWRGLLVVKSWIDLGVRVDTSYIQSFFTKELFEWDKKRRYPEKQIRDRLMICIKVWRQRSISPEIEQVLQREAKIIDDPEDIYHFAKFKPRSSSPRIVL
ncbi:hypothetical protein V1514DRAFT_334359 [Lipomyces japonicus]|uniref:uncharacterized protein n=1 Tax=Lipomyces japonicus TaxID=56871 RepID=UPI0034CE0E16